MNNKSATYRFTLRMNDKYEKKKKMFRQGFDNYNSIFVIFIVFLCLKADCKKSSYLYLTCALLHQNTHVSYNTTNYN